MKTFENAKVGDEVWCFRNGWGNVIKNDNNIEVYPIMVQFSVRSDTYTFEGRSSKSDANPSLFWDEIKFDIPDKPKVLVDKVITMYCNIYTSHSGHALLNLNATLAMSCIYSTKSEAENSAGKNPVFKGAEVTIKYQTEE